MLRRKVLYIITKGNWGGAQRYVFDLATHLSREEFEPVVAMGDGTILKERLDKAGIRTVRLEHLSENRRALPRSNDVYALQEIIRLLKKERPDIVHLNSSRASLFGVLSSRLLYLFSFLGPRAYRLNPRLIFTVHGWPFKEPRSALVKHILWLVSYITAVLAHRTIVLSEGDYALGIHMPGVQKKLSLIYNGIERAETLPRDDARRSLGLPSTAFVIGTIAELNRNKGIPTLIEALTTLPGDTHLCLIGDGEDREKLRALAHFRGVTDRIIFAGAQEQATKYLSAFDVFALPSLKEGLPYTVMEAGLSGIPVVASNISGIRDIIHTAETGILVPPQRAQELANALRKLIGDRALRENLGRALQTRIEQAFSLSRMQNATTNLYR